MPKRLPNPPYKIDIMTKCWIWLGTTRGGYGMITNPNYHPISNPSKMIGAHVYFYEQKYGKVPNGLVLDHIICDNRICCNPDHVIPKTHTENIRRGRVAKISINLANMIREDLRNGLSQIQAAKKYNLSQPTISQIARNETWK